jgi:hypothetical protein
MSLPYVICARLRLAALGLFWACGHMAVIRQLLSSVDFFKANKYIGEKNPPTKHSL